MCHTTIVLPCVYININMNMCCSVGAVYRVWGSVAILETPRVCSNMPEVACILHSWLICFLLGEERVTFFKK